MKVLTEEEFTDRALALQRAKRIFIDSGLTQNITNAFRAYQTIFAERERQIILSTKSQGNRPRTIMDKYERPKCPECNADMMFRQVAENPDGIEVQLVCIKCDTILNSKNDLEWWSKNLRRIDGLSSTSEGTVQSEEVRSDSGNTGQTA